MQLITLDFETYFDTEYSLTRLTSEEYVRDPRFKAHCVGIRWPNGDVSVTSGKELKSYVDWSKTAVLAHHAHFDGLILSHHYGLRPAFYFCTLSMARLVFPHVKSHSLGALAKMLGLEEKTVPYESFKGVRDLPPDLYNRVADGCAQDVELTYAIFKRILPYIPPEELRVIDLTIRMFTGKACPCARS